MLIPCTSKSGIFLGVLLASSAIAKPASANTTRPAMPKVFIVSSFKRPFERSNFTATMVGGQAREVVVRGGTPSWRKPALHLQPVEGDAYAETLFKPMRISTRVRTPKKISKI